MDRIDNNLLYDHLCARTALVVRATAHERAALYRETGQPGGWMVLGKGLGGGHFAVGTVGGRPLMIDAVWATVNGRVVMFWEPAGRAFDAGAWGAWLAANGIAPAAADGRPAHCTAGELPGWRDHFAG